MAISDPYKKSRNGSSREASLSPVLPSTHQHGRQPLPALSLSQLASSFLENKPLLIWEKIFILCLLAYSRAHRKCRMDAKSSLDSFRRVSQTDGTAWHDSHHVLGVLVPARAQGYAGALHFIQLSWHHLLIWTRIKPSELCLRSQDRASWKKKGLSSAWPIPSSSEKGSDQPLAHVSPWITGGWWLVWLTQL